MLGNELQLDPQLWNPQFEGPVPVPAQQPDLTFLETLPTTQPKKPRRKRKEKPLPELSEPVDSSLSLLTRRLVSLLRAQKGPVSMPEIRKKLAEGRRVYDAVGVLEGVGICRRGEKGGVEMTVLGRAVMDPRYNQPSLAQLEAELETLTTAHSDLVASNRTLLSDPAAQKYLYVTYRDVMDVFPGKKVLAVRAPGGSVVGVDESEERYEMSLTTREEEDVVEVVEVTGQAFVGVEDLR